MATVTVKVSRFGAERMTAMEMGVVSRSVRRREAAIKTDATTTTTVVTRMVENITIVRRR